MPEHLGRTLSAMADAGIDALILGREGNARFVSGAERLSLNGTRPFGPGCVVVRATANVHLLSTTDSGIPSEIGHDQLYPLSWNPMTIAGAVAAIPGMADAATVGVDGMTPMMEQLLGAVLAERDVRRRRGVASRGTPAQVRRRSRWDSPRDRRRRTVPRGHGHRGEAWHHRTSAARAVRGSDGPTRRDHARLRRDNLCGWHRPACDRERSPAADR